MMRNETHDYQWSPFDPKWYQQAFDKYISTSDELFNSDEISSQGYVLPDADGSKSSVFRREAVLNNSFNEALLRDTLKDIYLNSSYKLIASNHDNVRFYKWFGTMKDMHLIPNTNLCEIVLPTETFIMQKSRDKFKLSQFYRKWISITELHNNWDIFKFDILLFINKRIYSEYEVRIDDHQTTLRFRYEAFWLNRDYPIYVYKFDTNAQCRVKISRELVVNQWNWKMPISYISDPRIFNSPNLIGLVNKIADNDIRSDGNPIIDIMGDNIEFMNIEDGYIDLSKMSEFNKELIFAETTSHEWIWLTLIAPKFFHEYPILLPTDIVYRPYQPDYRAVHVFHNGTHMKVKTDQDIENDHKQIYINMDEHFAEWNDGWKLMIRPIVLADAFDEQQTDPYISITNYMNRLRDLTVEGADIIEDFRMYMKAYTSDERFLDFCQRLESKITEIHEVHNQFLIDRRIELNRSYDAIYEEFLTVMDDIIAEENYQSIKRFNRQHAKYLDFWAFVSPLIYIPRDLADKYYISTILSHISSSTVWESSKEFMGKSRFMRPIDESDFWTFEYDMENNVWRPCILNIERHFPDVYMVNDPAEETPTANRVFKAFFFYADNMNVRETSRDITRATPSWTDDMEEFAFEKTAIYRDIFMEKFYWMGVRSIYRGLMTTKYRWEALEYVSDNASYERFNELFLKTMDPYFKMGLATYLRSSNFEFPFDDAISKLNEAINTEFLGYKKITNFEMYLNKTWIPSYFDYIVRIMPDWDGSKRLIRRPRDSFDTRRILPTLKNTEVSISSTVTVLKSEVTDIIDKIKYDGFDFVVDRLEMLMGLINQLDAAILKAIDYTNELDLDIFSIEDVNTLISLLEDYRVLSNQIEDLFRWIYANIGDTEIYDKKLAILTNMVDLINNDLYELTFTIGSMIQTFDIEGFMRGVNNPEFFDERLHKDDTSLIGMINNFESSWPDYIKAARNDLYVSTTALWAAYHPEKSYSQSEIEKFVQLVYDVQHDVVTLNDAIRKCWREYNEDENELLVAHMNFASEKILELVNIITVYLECRIKLMDMFDRIRSMMIEVHSYGTVTKEDEFMSTIDTAFDEILKHVSYIAGENHKADALAEHSKSQVAGEEWVGLILRAKDIFERIMRLSRMPNIFVDSLSPHHKLLDAMIEYMKTLDREFIPDSTTPTYSKVYEIEEIELVHGGYLHQVDDEVYFPNLGVYKVAEIIGDTNKCSVIEPSNCRTTTFRDPCTQNVLYDSFTSGEGLGITAKANSSTSVNIINDTVISTYIERVNNIIYLVNRDINIINPYANFAAVDTVDKAKQIKTDWDNLMSYYSEYMSDEVHSAADYMINKVSTLFEPLQILIDARTSNDVKSFLIMFEKLIIDSYTAFQNRSMINPNYLYFDNRMRVVYNTAKDYYGNGTMWNDSDQLKTILADTLYETKLFSRKMLVKLPDEEDCRAVLTLRDELYSMITQISDSLNLIPTTRQGILDSISEIESAINDIPETLQKDEWYKFTTSTPAESGRGYAIGDVVEIVPKLPTDIFGNEVHDNEEVIMNDRLFLQVTQVDNNGAVIKLKPIMEYALPYHLWGTRETISKIGHGEGLLVSVTSTQIELNDSTLFLDSSSDIAPPPQFDQNDLFTFKFENIHDLDMNYEVFYAGKQIHDFIIRHERESNHLYPREVDVVYLKANDVLTLQSSSVYLEGEHYFIYKLDSLEITEPGAGYSKGQEIVVDSDQVALHLKVASLLPGPLKKIGTVEMMNNYSVFNGTDPTSEHAKVAFDSLNNIDDEFNVGEYDRLTSEGILKPATPDLPKEEYPYVSVRYDDLSDGDRNKTFMYPDIPMPKGITPDISRGDPDSHIYLGTRIDNFYSGDVSDHWHGILETQPSTDPFIPDSWRVPVGKPVKGEYQTIDWIRLHDFTDPDMIESVSADRIAEIVETEEDIPESDKVFRVHDYEYTSIADADVLDILDGVRAPKSVPTVVVDGEIIKAIDLDRLEDLVYENIEAIPNPGIYMDECMVSTEPIKPTGTGITNALVHEGDLVVKSYASLPKHVKEWDGAVPGRTVVVESDETNGGHRMLYRLRTFKFTGYLVYDRPEVVDYKWNYFDIDWTKVDFYPDLPSERQQFPNDELWHNAKTYRIIQRQISEGNIDRIVTPIAHQGTYIANLTVDDLSVFNFTTKTWEDLHDSSRWKLEVREDDENEDWGFRLTFLLEGSYSYDMRLYLNKIPDTQMRNAALKKDAVFKVKASIIGEVNTPNRNFFINTGRDLMIRKLFPYEQKESYVIGTDKRGNLIGYEMDFKIANYMHFKNQIHLEDIQIYNKSAGRFEDISDPALFEVQFKDDKATSRGYETQTTIVQTYIDDPGTGFNDGIVWGWNDEFGIQIFGRVTADFMNDGSLLTFQCTHCPNPPTDDISLEFKLYQWTSELETAEGAAVIEFQTQRIEVYGDGYYHKVTNPMAVVPREFKVICQYNLDEPGEYDIIISKTPRTWTFVLPEWKIFPTFHLEGVRIPQDRIYISTDNGRLPLINPSTGKPTLSVSYTDDGTDVLFLNLYHKYEHFEIHSVPYPMRSVYVQRKVPVSGYVDLQGKINKPINKKYFEFWMNGRLLHDEVTIISPTKLFLHGLKSLRNFEIIEINRDPNEYFSDNFLEVVEDQSKTYPTWNFDTYLDDALEGTLDGNNYTIEEQEYLLSPVWRQVEKDHPEYKNYPPNVDSEPDVLLRVDNFADAANINSMPAYQFTIIDIPTLEGVPILGRGLNWESFGFKPITQSEIIDMLNEEWNEEIEKELIPSHSIISDDEWYGMATRMYDEYGLQVHTLNEAAYKVIDSNILRINSDTKMARITHNSTMTYDLD